jgi:hypothetical protein
MANIADEMKGKPEADLSSEGQSGAAQEPAGAGKSRGFFDTSQRPFEGHMRQGAQEVLKKARLRRCSCGGSMGAYFIRRYYVWYLMPSGHELHYRCPSCGKVIGIASGSDLLQAVMLIAACGVAIFFIGKWALAHSLEDFSVAGVLGTGLLVFLFGYSLYQLYSGVRVRRAHPVV